MTGVSVVLPVRNGERYLAEALASVLRERPDEVIVVDDGSSDGSAALAERFGPPVTCIRQAPAGAGAARNRGVAAAAGPYLAFIDADDVWVEGRLQAQLAALDAVPEVDLVFGQVVHFFSAELPDAERARLRCPEGAAPALLPGTMLARLARFCAVGPLREDLTVGEFVEWMLRARAGGLSERVLDRPVLRRRLHAANQGIVRRDAMGDYLRVARAALARRRAGGGGS